MLRPHFVALLAFTRLLSTPLWGNPTLESLPFAPEEAAVIRRLVAREGVEVTLESGRAHSAAKHLLSWLNDPSLSLENLAEITIADSNRAGSVLSIIYNEQGHILCLRGNGPWIHNETLAEFPALPELRVIRVDHNSRHHQDPERGPDYRGEGFAALEHSKVAIVGLTSGPDDNGFAAIKNLKNLEWLELFHVPITEEAIKQLAFHPTLVHLRLGKMGELPASILEVVGTIPNLRELRFNEAYITYENGLDHLKPLAGQLTLIDLKSSLITRADHARLKADHPQATITSSTPEEVGKGHIGVARRLAREDLPAELGDPFRAALESR